MTEPASFGLRTWFRIELLNHALEKAQVYHDRKWLHINFTVDDSSSQFRCCGPWLMTGELDRLCTGAESLLSGKKDNYRFDPLESFWSLEISKADSLGHYRFKLEIRPFPGMTTAENANHHYEFFGDQSDLQILVSELLEAMRHYPTR
jgi:hypothetical protein